MPLLHGEKRKAASQTAVCLEMLNCAVVKLHGLLTKHMEVSIVMGVPPNHPFELAFPL
jgi:hypothetical protein